MDTQEVETVRTQWYEVTGGDSKEKLLAQLFDIGRIRNRPPFRMTIMPRDEAHPHPLEASLLVNGITAESGSGDRWIITGHLNSARFDKRTTSFKSFYDTRTRTGWMELTG